jgi:putative ABC transport system permease protein
VLLGIALGAAVFTSVRLAVHATLDSFTRSMDLIAGDSDLTLVRPGGRVPDTLVSADEASGRRTASPVLSVYVRPADRETPFLLIGIDPILDRDLRTWTVQSPGQGAAVDWASMIAQPGTMIIGGRLGDTFDWRAGQTDRTGPFQPDGDFKVLATLDPDGLALVEGGAYRLVRHCHLPGVHRTVRPGGPH